MIIRDYYQNINIHQPRDYFEHWYADVWRRRIGTRTAPPGMVERIMDEELEQVGATFTSTDRGYKFRVYFDDDDDYIMFKLKWS